MPAAVAIPAVMGAVGVGGNIVSGLIGASGAKKAAQVQADAAAAAARHVEDVTNTVNPNIGATATTAGNQVVDTAGATGNKVIDAGNVAGQGVTTATGQANDMLDPYRQAGEDSNATLRTLLATGGDLNRNFSLEDFTKNDPGFQFRLDKAQQALERSQAARGGGLGGGAAKELNREIQGVASGEFGSAFNRFETQNNDRFSRLNALAGRGFQASDESGQNLIGGYKYAGDTGVRTATTAGDWANRAAEFKGSTDVNAADLMAKNSIDATRTAADLNTQGAAATAGGIVGRTNAITGAINGGIGAVNGAINLRQLLQNPSLNTGPYYNPNGTTTNPDGSITIRRSR